MRHLDFELSANVSLLFADLDYLDRFGAARAAGFAAVETWWPFAAAVPSDGELVDFLGAITGAGVRLRGLNFFAGAMQAGERGIATRPERRGELDANLAAVAAIAQATGCRRFNLLYGQLTDGVDPAAQHAAAAAAIADAAAAVAPFDGVVLIEPLAAGLNGSYPLRTHTDVLTLLAGPLAGVDNVGLLFDTFHLAMNGVDLPAAVRESAARIRHVQIADAPGRGEPGSGHVPWDEVFTALLATGYDGLVAAEYVPTGATADSFGWIAR